MNTKLLLSYKTLPEVQILNLYLDINITNKNKSKNNIINQKKEINNKINLLLNKLSESNMKNIILEFINTLNHLSLTEYEEFIKIIYIKILSEIKFINIYINFIKNINNIYNHVLNYNLDFFYSSIESKFKLDYFDNFIINDKFNYIDKLSEFKINNLILIKYLTNNNFLSDDLINICDEIILNQKKDFIDIYYWKPKLNDININKIKMIINNNTLSLRDKILLESLINNNDNNNEIIIDEFILEYNYILTEYLNNENFDNILIFLNTKCNDAIKKNIFLKNLINKYYKENSINDDFTKILNLIKYLYSNNKISKNNINKLINLCKENVNKNIILNNLLNN
jgi:hypothetical protein